MQYFLELNKSCQITLCVCVDFAVCVIVL